MVPNQESKLKDCVYAIDRNLSRKQLDAEVSQTNLDMEDKDKQHQEDKELTSLKEGNIVGNTGIAGENEENAGLIVNEGNTKDITAEDEAKDSASRVATNDLFSETNILQGGDTVAVEGYEMTQRLRGGSDMYNNQFSFDIKQRVVDRQAAGCQIFDMRETENKGFRIVQNKSQQIPCPPPCPKLPPPGPVPGCCQAPMMTAPGGCWGCGSFPPCGSSH